MVGVPLAVSLIVLLFIESILAEISQCLDLTSEWEESIGSFTDPKSRLKSLLNPVLPDTA